MNDESKSTASDRSVADQEQPDCDVYGVRRLDPHFSITVDRWTSEPPNSEGLYLWTDPTGCLTCIFTVCERWDRKLHVSGNSLPIDDYRGFWIGPIEGCCELVTEKTPRHLIQE